MASKTIAKGRIEVKTYEPTPYDQRADGPDLVEIWRSRGLGHHHMQPGRPRRPRWYGAAKQPIGFRVRNHLNIRVCLYLTVHSLVRNRHLERPTIHDRVRDGVCAVGRVRTQQLRLRDEGNRSATSSKIEPGCRPLLCVGGIQPAVGGEAGVMLRTASVHLHTREDEFSFVLEGRWGFILGSSVVYAEPGDLVFKPRDVWHTFWNATDRPARLLEIISPAGFEQLFVELDELMRTDPENVEAASALGAKYGVESDQEATERVAAEHGLIERPA